MIYRKINFIVITPTCKAISRKKAIGYYSINNLIEGYICKFTVCVQITRIIHGLDILKSITINFQTYRYEFDITYLNNDL